MYNGRNNNYRPFIRVAEKKKVRIHNLEFNGNRNQIFDFENKLPYDIKYIAKRANDFWKNTKNKKIHLINKFCKIWMRDQNLVHSHFFKINQKSKLLPKNWSDKKKNIVFFCNSDDESLTGGKEYFFKISQSQYEIIKIVYNIIKTKDNFKNIDFWVRMHPRMRGFGWPFLTKVLNLEKELNNLNLIKAQSPISSYEMLKKSDLIMSPNSTLTIEAEYFSKTVINFQEQPFTKLGGGYVPQTKMELNNLIFKKNLKPASKIAAKKYLLFYLDGGKKDKRISGGFYNNRMNYSYQNKKIKKSYFGAFFYIIGKVLEIYYKSLNFYLYKMSLK